MASCKVEHGQRRTAAGAPATARVQLVCRRHGRVSGSDVERRPGGGFLTVAFGLEIDELDRDDTGAVQQRDPPSLQSADGRGNRLTCPLGRSLPRGASKSRNHSGTCSGVGSSTGTAASP